MRPSSQWEEFEHKASPVNVKKSEMFIFLNEGDVQVNFADAKSPISLHSYKIYTKRKKTFKILF